MVNPVASKLLNQRGLYTVPYAFESDMLADLANDDLDACASSTATIAYYIHTHDGSGLRFVRAFDGEPELSWNVAVGLSRSDGAMVGAVDRALAQMLRDGTLARIYDRYGVAYRTP